MASEPTLVQYNPDLYPDWDLFVEMIRFRHKKDLSLAPLQIVDLDGENLMTLAQRWTLDWFKQLLCGVPFPVNRKIDDDPV